MLPELLKLNERRCRSSSSLGPAARNTVPIADYLAPRANSFGAFYASAPASSPTATTVGRYARFALSLDPTIIDRPATARRVRDQRNVFAGLGFCYNAYPSPNDTLDNQPFSGEYPRLLPLRAAAPSVRACNGAEG